MFRLSAVILSAVFDQADPFLSLTVPNTHSEDSEVPKKIKMGHMTQASLELTCGQNLHQR